MGSILVVDDDRQFRGMVREILQLQGHTVLEAADGRRVLELCQNEQVDLVIMDIIMPDKEGLEVITELRRALKDLRIIAVSGGGRIGPETYLDVAGKLGADRTLSKPFRRKELLEAVDALAV